MGTNFYWKKLPKELEKFRTPENEEMLMHLGKRSAAGKYCRDCGTTLNRWGTQYVHRGGIQEIDWYNKCPICGGEGKNSCSFTWTFLLQKKILERLYDKSSDKLIVNEYGDEFTVREFYTGELEAYCPIQFQAAADFS